MANSVWKRGWDYRAFRLSCKGQAKLPPWLFTWHQLFVSVFGRKCSLLYLVRIGQPEESTKGGGEEINLVI